ncbi:MxaK protein [Paraburkholderia jirisanensis]
MRRRSVHVLFGVATACCAALAAYYALELERTIELGRAIAATRTATVAQLAAGPADDAPEVRLARAVALSAAHRQAEAGKLFNELIQQSAPADVRRAALFDLANMNLREAAGDDARGPLRSRPLIELAKTRYRDLLRDDATDLGARYNLERTLRLAPETADEAEAEKDIEQQRNVTVRGAVAQELP